jgi:hypothetical protein
VTLFEMDRSHHQSDNTTLEDVMRIRRRGDIPGEFPTLVDPNGMRAHIRVR